MPFHIIENSTATIPYDMNDNFLHVAQGSITPKTGSMLEETTASINIGSSTYIWNKGYFDGTVSSENGFGGNSFYQIFNFNLTLPTTKIEISNLNDDFSNIFISSNFSYNSSATDFIRLYINGDSNTSNYYSIYNIAGNLITSTSYIRISIMGKQNQYFETTNIKSKSGDYKIIYNRGTYNPTHDIIFGLYSNISTLTTLVFIPESGSTIQTGTSIRLFCYGMD